MKDDKFLEGQLEDKIRLAADKYIVTYSGFLDAHARAVAERVIKRNNPGAHIELMFWGGYEDAERAILLCVPDYTTLEESDPLAVIRVSVKDGGRKFSHGDYLGSLTGLGLKRDKIGDILVRDNGADIIVLREIVEFLMTNYAKAGRAQLSLEELSASDLIVDSKPRKVVSDTVASLRLDSIVASAFGLPRSKAQEAIKSGRVFVDSLEILKADYVVGEGNKITLRGKGKILLSEIGGKSRKDRQYVTYEKYQ